MARSFFRRSCARFRWRRSLLDALPTVSAMRRISSFRPAPPPGAPTPPGERDGKDEDEDEDEADVAHFPDRASSSLTTRCALVTASCDPRRFAWARPRRLSASRKACASQSWTLKPWDGQRPRSSGRVEKMDWSASVASMVKYGLRSGLPYAAMSLFPVARSAGLETQ
jgi:hypothetical protein